MSIYETKEYKDSIKPRVSYEWWVEHTDEYEDITDCYQIEFTEWPVDDVTNCTTHLLLKRFSGNDSDGVKEIGNAYVLDGMVEDFFDTGKKVPKKYKSLCEKHL